MYQALYRKWRPATFDDVVGQEHITTTLKNQVAAGKPSHAYLFTGSRGTGKTTCSKILAKAVNCPNEEGGNPCGICPICTGIDEDSILDVTEIDAASNSGVDNIRELREEANFTPVTTTYRVYIIDETHMLSTGAFNALLKIMEEPPAHVLFVLATTEIHKVPATILSRCQRFDFQRISSAVIAQRLLYVAGEEGITLAEDAALLIARLSDGSMRDALSLLDLCMAQAREITYDIVQQTAGLADQSYLADMAETVIQEDFSAAMGLLAQLWEQSLDAQQFCQQFLGFYRNLLVVKTVTDPTELVEGTTADLERLETVAEQYPLGRVFYSMSTLSDTLARMGQTAQRRAELEMGLLKLCSPEMDASPDALVARIEKLERAVKHGQVAIQAAQQEESTPAPSDVPADSAPETVAAPVTESADTAPSPAPREEDPPPEASSQPLNPPAATSEPDPSRTQAIPFVQWPEVMEVIKDTNIALYGTLVNSSAYLAEDILLVDAGSGLFAQMIRNDDYARESLRKAAQQVTGRRFRLGPYQEEQFQVRAPESDLLDKLIHTGQELGVDMEIKD